MGAPILSFEWELLTGATQVNLYRKYSAPTLPLILFILVALEILDVYLLKRKQQPKAVFYLLFSLLRPLIRGICYTLQYLGCHVLYVTENMTYVLCAHTALLHFPYYLPCD